MLEKQSCYKDYAGKKDFFDGRRFLVVSAIAVSFMTVLFVLVFVMFVLTTAALTVNMFSKMIVFVCMFHVVLLLSVIRRMDAALKKCVRDSSRALALLSERCERRNVATAERRKARPCEARKRPTSHSSICSSPMFRIFVT